MEAATLDAAGRPEPGASDAPVPWWSFTKTLIAAAVLRRVEQGRLALDAPCPGTPGTLRQVLQHRAGLGDYGALPEYHAAVARGDAPWAEAEILARVPDVFAPGEGWAYSNIGYLRLRRVVEAATGMGLGPALRDLVLAPLGLGRSRLAVAPVEMDATPFPGGHGYHPGWVYHGAVVGPPVEAALALHGLLRGRLLRPDTLAAMVQAHPVGGPMPDRPWQEAGYGLGLMIGTMQGPGMARPLRAIGHSAGGPGSVGAVYHAPETGRTAAVFVAGDAAGAAEREALRRLLA